MEKQHKLHMVLLGCLPQGRFTEQHDIFFGIAKNLKDLIPDIHAFWPEAKGNIHIDVWREVTQVEGFAVEVVPKNEPISQLEKLFFVNLGGYRPGEFEEYHYKMLVVAPSLGEAVKKAKTTSFYKHFGFKGAVSHVDDKFGLDVDGAFDVSEILPKKFTQAYRLKISRAVNTEEDSLQIGYLKLNKVP